MRLSVIIVSYNVRHYLEQCLDSLLKALRGIEAELIVVDNHSRDDTVRCLHARYPMVSVVESNHNLGFSRANNIGIRQSTGEYVLLVNPDTFVAEDTIGGVLHFMDCHPKAGGAGVMMYKPDGTVAMESRRGLPSPMTAFYKMSGLCALYPKSRRFGKYYMGYLPWDTPQRIDVVSGAFFMVRRAALDAVGLLDESFFMYAEDIDLSYRLLRGGWENWYLPLPILHYKGESTQKTSFRYVHVFYNAMLIFLQKHYRPWALLLYLPIKATIYVKATLALLQSLAERASKSMGFVRRSGDSPSYSFIGSPQMVEACMSIARRRGLAVKDDGMGDVTVYDVASFSFKEILRRIAARASSGAVVGTYSPKTKTIITPEEILQ